MAGQTSQTFLSGGVAVTPYYSIGGILALIGANYTITDSDGYGDIHVTAGASDRTVTLPAAASTNAGRRIRFLKVDSGAGGVVLSGTISGGTTNNTIKAQYGYCEVISNGSSWFWITDIQETGAWTPVATAATPGTGSNGSNVGRYTRTGRLVTLSGDTSYTKGTASGALTITGQPFANRTGNAVALSGGFLNYTTAPASRRDDIYWMSTGSSVMLVYWKGGTTATNYVAAAAADLGTTVAFLIGGSYHIT